MFIKHKKNIILSMSVICLLSNHLYAKSIDDLGTIVVTAQKPKEQMQNVPISLTVFDDVDMEDKKIESVQDIAKYTPNLMFFKHGAPSMLSPSSRGLFSEIQTLTTSVGMYIDGIPVSFGFGFDEALMDIKQIEILRGPQGTLYGKNTEAGAINIITNQPNNQTKVAISGQIGEDNKKQIAVNASGAIVKDKLYIGISARYYEKDGFLRNGLNNSIVNNKENNYGKVHFRYTPTDSLEFSLISSKLKYSDDDWAMNNTSAKKMEVNSDFKGCNKPESFMHALKVSKDFGNSNFTSITTQRIYKDIGAHDFDHTKMAIMHTKKRNIFKKISQEFRFSQQKQRYNWLIGLYGDKDKNLYDYETSLIKSKFAGAVYRELEDYSLGLFMHGSFNINDKLTLIGGLRYDKDNKKFKDKAANIDLQRDGSNISPKIALNYHYSKELMTYANMLKGYRTGGFNPFAPKGYSKTYDEETLISYEVGTKGTFFNNALHFNIAFYYMDINDMQVNTSLPNGGFSSYMSNAAQAESKGIEIEGNCQVSNTVNIFGSFGYNNTKFKKFKDSKGDYTKKTNPYSPKYNYNIGAQYRSGGGYYGRIDINGYGKMYFDKANTFARKAYNLVDVKIGYEYKNFDIYLYGKNIFDTNHDSWGYFGGKYVIYSEPREIGLQVTYRF